MYRCRVGEAAVVVLWLSQWNREGPRARVRVEGEKRASLLLRVMNNRSLWLGSCQRTPSRWIQGASSRRIPKPPGFCEAVGGFDLGTAVAAVHAHRDGQGPGQRVEAAVGTLGQQLQQLAQFVAPGGGLPEQGEGVGQGPPAVAGAAQLGGGANANGIFEVEQARFPDTIPDLNCEVNNKGRQPCHRNASNWWWSATLNGYVAYPLGITGVVVGQGDSYEAALEDVRSALAFHIETFGMESLMQEDPVEEVFLAETVLVG